ncbi:hypothetical protein ACLESD_25135 [Pyxidicoccus sp. 3LFB2]
MSILRLSFAWSAALLLTFATAAVAEPTEGATCDDSAQAASSGGSGEESLLCHAALCNSDWDCQASCPSALTATCVQYACEYTYSTGGGGGGGGGPFCHARFCSDDWDCECNGRYGFCGADSTCHF